MFLKTNERRCQTVLGIVPPFRASHSLLLTGCAWGNWNGRRCFGGV